MERHGSGCAWRCGRRVNRRRFLVGAGAAAAAAQMEVLNFASSLFAAPPEPAGRPTLSVVFVRPAEPLVVSWPGGNCDTAAQQALFTKTLREAAKALDVQLDVRDKHLWDKAEITAFCEQIKTSPPDGLILCAMCLRGWGQVRQILAGRGNVPTIIYSNMSGFTKELQAARNTPGVVLAATQDVGWLAMAVRMLNAIWRMKHTRILVINSRGGEKTCAGVGTTFVGGGTGLADALKEVEETDEVRAIADFYAKGAEKVVEPTKANILHGAKIYVALRRMMAEQKCQGLTFPGCLNLREPPCLALSKLRDEGMVATCEGCSHAAVGERLTFLLFNRPTFIQDPSPNTVNNTLNAAHCTSPTKLEGCDRDYRAPYLLRSFHTKTGCSVQVLWPVGKEMTLIQFAGDGRSMMLGTGRVVANIAQPPSGCCRTAVEVTVDGCDDTRDVKGFHQLFILGNLARAFKMYGTLAGIRVDRIY